MPEPAKKPQHIAAVEDRQTCFNCAEVEARSDLVAANYRRALIEIGRLKETLTRALGRESHIMDPREPHRRKV